MEMESLVWVIWFTAGLTAGRKVLLPTGPLIRVEGQPLSVRCEVSEYEGPKEQEFDWKAKRGSETVAVMSTFDSTFPDQSVEDRVASGDVSLERLGDSTVELRIREARVSDSATYTCSTPSTDSVISGNYGADVLLRVIPNTLAVTPVAPVPSVHEGRSIDLRCNVSHDFTHGIYLSVTWSVRRGQSERDLVTFGPDLGVEVGGDFVRRYADGGMRVRPETDGSYGLVLSGAEPADEGVYACTVKQWTVEGGGWNRIQEKTEVMGEVAVVPTAKSLTVQVLDRAVVTAGDNLSLTCLVSAGDRSVLGLEVTWLLNGTQVLTHLGKDGVESKASNVYRISQAGEGDFRLEVHGVETSDAGLYTCRVRAWIKRCGGKWYQAAETTSTPVEVTVAVTDPAMSVTLDSSVIPQYLGDSTELVCEVSNVSLLWGKKLGVSWFYSATPSADGNATDQSIGSLDENGALVTGEKYRSRFDSGLVAVTRTEPATFKLRLLRTASQDAGRYVCAVTTWALGHLGEWKKSAEYRADALTVSLAAKGPGISVVARRTRQATIGSTFEMTCQAKLKNLQEDATLSVVVSAQTTVGAPGRRLASLSPDMVLRVEDWRKSGVLDSISLVKTGKNEFQFQIQGVQETDRGFYWCEIAAWTKQDEKDWVEVAKGESNKVQIAFDYTKPSFELQIASDTTDVYPWETVRIECVLSVFGTPPKADDLAFEIRWYLRRLQGSDAPTLLASMDRSGVVRKSLRNASSDCSVERSRAQTFALNVHGTQDSDAGEYYCLATPWIRSRTSDVWSKEPEIGSEKIFLSVKFALWDSMKLPLLYGTCTSLLIGLFSLVLGVVCTHCCCRDNTNASNTRIKLISQQID